MIATASNIWEERVRKASSYFINTQYSGITLERAQQAVHAINELMAQLNQRLEEG